MVQPYSNTDMAMVWKNPHWNLLESTDFHMVDNLLMAVHALPVYMLKLFQLIRYCYWGRRLGLLISEANHLNGEMALFWLKPKNSVLSEFL